jgi:hypothetical protein
MIIQTYQFVVHIKTRDVIKSFLLIRALVKPLLIREGPKLDIYIYKIYALFIFVLHSTTENRYLTRY